MPLRPSLPPAAAAAAPQAGLLARGQPGRSSNASVDGGSTVDNGDGDDEEGEGDEDSSFRTATDGSFSFPGARKNGEPAFLSAEPAFFRATADERRAERASGGRPTSALEDEGGAGGATGAAAAADGAAEAREEGESELGAPQRAKLAHEWRELVSEYGVIHDGDAPRSLVAGRFGVLEDEAVRSAPQSAPSSPAAASSRPPRGKPGGARVQRRSVPRAVGVRDGKPVGDSATAAGNAAGGGGGGGAAIPAAGVVAPLSESLAALDVEAHVAAARANAQMNENVAAEQQVESGARSF